jgi:hypothetical protein
MSDLHEQIKLTFSIYLKEIEDLEKKGKKVSAVRARKALQDLKELITARRAEIQNIKHSD